MDKLGSLALFPSLPPASLRKLAVGKGSRYERGVVKTPEGEGLSEGEASPLLSEVFYSLELSE